jgi:flagellar motility protein MotE (MotC chaperone)
LAKGRNGKDKQAADASATPWLPGGEQSKLEAAKAVVISPLTAEDANEPPVIISSAPKPVPAITPDATISAPIAASELPEAAALQALVPVIVEQVEAEAAKPGLSRPEAGRVHAAAAEPGKSRTAKGDMALLPAASPLATPAPVLAPPTGKNHTIAEKSPRAAVANAAKGKPGQGGKSNEPARALPNAAALTAAWPVTMVGSGVEPAKAEAHAQSSAPVVTTTVAEPGPAPAQAGPPTPAGVEAEPDDPFVDVQLTQKRGEGDTLTTQVVPTNTPPETTGQTTPVDRSPAAQYCSNIADAAIDARIAWQRQNLAEAEKQIAARTEELEAKTAEYQRWLARRDEFSEKAKKVVVDIYTKMKPDAAAQQLQVLEEETAAAVLVKLDARSASAVMNEMEPVKAARLTAIISGSARGPQSRGRQPPPATGNRS